MLLLLLKTNYPQIRRFLLRVNIEEYHKMHAMERTYWWFQGRRRILHTMLDTIERERESQPSNGGGRPVILDIGCGTGMLLEDLSRYGFAAGLDFSPVALSYCRGHDLAHLGRADVRHLPVRSDSVDLITAVDLVEHIQDDVGLMGEFFRVLRPGGYALLSVPAHKKLWSPHDIALHHFRRYEKPEFRSLVEKAGLVPRRFTYSMATAYLPARLFRSMKRRMVEIDPGAPATTDEFRIPRPLNALLRGMVYAEAALLKRSDLPVGLSILCIAQKPPAG